MFSDGEVPGRIIDPAALGQIVDSSSVGGRTPVDSPTLPTGRVLAGGGGDTSFRSAGGADSSIRVVEPPIVDRRNVDRTPSIVERNINPGDSFGGRTYPVVRSLSGLDVSVTAQF